MVNPGSLMKLMNAKKQFTNTHPKFEAYLKAVTTGGIPEGTIIEVKVTKPGQAPMTSNIKVQQSDLELFESLKDLK